MKLFFSIRNNRIFVGFIAALFLINLLNIIFNTPMILDQHWAQKIFYVHVPSAWVGFLSYFIVMIAGFMLFIKNDDTWDDICLLYTSDAADE